MTSIPIRVIPQNALLVKDMVGGYHLNVGFHISFEVKDLMKELVKMTDEHVEAETSFVVNQERDHEEFTEKPLSHARVAKKAYQKKNVYPGGKFKWEKNTKKFFSWEKHLESKAPTYQ